MESYFGISSSGLKEKFKSKLVQASKYIPKDIVNKAQNAMKRGKNGSFLQTGGSGIGQHLEEDYVHVDVGEANHSSGNGANEGDDQYFNNGSDKRRKSTSDKFQSPNSDGSGSVDSSGDRKVEDDKDKYFRKLSDNPLEDLAKLEDKYQVIQQHRLH